MTIATTSALPPESVILSPLATSFVLKRYTSSPPPPTSVSAPDLPSIISSSPSPFIVSLEEPPVRVSPADEPFSVVIRLGPVMFVTPVALIVITSLPLVKELAVIFAKLAVVPEATVITRVEVPAAVSVNKRVSPVN